MSLKHHLQNTLKLMPAASPAPRMFLCGVGVLVPLLVGYYQNQLAMAMFGSLVSFLLVLNDQAAPLRRRLYNFTGTFVILWLGLEVGIRLSEHPRLFMLALLAMSYFIGLMEAKNSEFEKALLFATFQMLAGNATPVLEIHLYEILAYALLGYGVTMIAVILIALRYGQTPAAFQRYRDTIRSTLTTDGGRHFYALTYSATVLLALFIMNYFHIDHGYWAVGTVLITMRPDSMLSVYRSLQRLFGTLLGVLIAGFLIYYIREPAFLIVLALLMAIAAPWALASGYWLGSGVMAVMILLLMDLPYAADGNLHTPFLRLQATALGCGLTIVAVLVTNLHRRWLKLFFQ